MSNDKITMEENANLEGGISLIDIIRLLFQKIKLLILVVLIGGICGGVFGVFHTIDMKYYGTSIEFYVNPEKPSQTGSSSNTTANAVGSQYGVYGAYGRHVMDAIIKLLSSESFIEQLMLEEDGLPSQKLYPGLNQDNYTKAQEAITKAEAEWAKAESKDEDLAVALELVYEKWDKVKPSTSFSKQNYAVWYEWYLSLDKDSLSPANANKYEELINAYDTFDVLDHQRDDALIIATKIQEETNAIVEVLFEEWRDHANYAPTLNRFKNTVKYSYLGENEDVEDANNLARSFIYVNINVLNDQAFAKDLLTRVLRCVPEYVEQNMIVPTDYEGTSCTRITRTDDIRRTNPHYRRNQSIKYAVIAAMLAGLIAALLVVIVDAQDKRLRDYEFISKQLKVPVLGVIPNIPELNHPAETKKQQNKGGK